MHPIAIVLNGASSAGKTSIARAMQEIWPAPLIHASLDSFTDVFRWSAIRGEEVRRECHTYGVASFHDYLSRAAASGFPLVVDHVFEQQTWYESTLEALKRLPTLVVGVRCPIDILEDREMRRNDRKAGMARWQHLRVHEGKRYDLEVDTKAVSAAECASVILRAARDK